MALKTYARLAFCALGGGGANEANLWEQVMSQNMTEASKCTCNISNMCHNGC